MHKFVLRLLTMVEHKNKLKKSYYKIIIMQLMKVAKKKKKKRKSHRQVVNLMIQKKKNLKNQEKSKLLSVLWIKNKFGQVTRLVEHLFLMLKPLRLQTHSNLKIMKIVQIFYKETMKLQFQQMKKLLCFMINRLQLLILILMMTMVKLKELRYLLIQI